MIRNGPSHLLAMTLVCFSTTLHGAENRVEFRTDANSFSGMQQRLLDPEQRRELRIQQRASVERQNPELQQALRLDSSTTEALLEMLTDQQIERIAETETIHSGGYTNVIQATADAETGRLDRLHELLGDEGLRRYQDYEATRNQLAQVMRVDARLRSNDKLSPAQRERLQALFVEQLEREMRHDLLRSRALAFPTLSPQQLTSAGLQRSSQLQTIAANEKSLYRARESNRLLLRDASAFLAPVQLQALSKDGEERDASQRQWIEQARKQAGLDPVIPNASATVDPDPPLRTPIAGNVRLSIRTTVNRNDGATVSLTCRNGEPRSFEAGEGLVVEVTPTLFDDDWLDVRFHYYEKDARGQRRRLSSSNGIQRSIAQGGNPADYAGLSSTVVLGTKAYAVTARVKVEGA